jgi:transposase, IS30 family
LQQPVNTEVAVGLKRGAPLVPRAARLVFWDLVRSGVAWREASVLAGLEHTAEVWFRLAGGVAACGPRGPVSGRFLSLAEREEIAIGLAAGLSQRVIAARLGRSPSTVCREIRRNKAATVAYRAGPAQSHAEYRARRPRTARLAADPVLRAWVQDKLECKWSPEQISEMLKREFPDDRRMRVSHETIYQSIYVQGRGALRRELAACLRTGRAIRKPRHRSAGAGRAGQLKDMVMISERPAEAADRAVPGHWEGDLIIGARGASAIGTLVERTTRFCLLLHLPASHDAVTVAHAVTAATASLPGQLRRSLTWDQGKEMALHRQISIDTELAVYFCDPHSPWQRGSNENTNGLLRQYFPKGTDLSAHSKDHLDAVAAELNARPRKTLSWHTPAQALQQILAQPPPPPLTSPATNAVATTG